MLLHVWRACTHCCSVSLCPHSHMFLCHVFGLGSSYMAAHCCSCSTPAFTHLNNCQLCVPLNFHLHSFGSSCLTGNGRSADQTTPHTCSPKCTVIHGNMHLFWQQSVICPLPSVCAALVHVEASCSYSPSHMVSPHFITPLSLVGSGANNPRWRGSVLELQKSSVWSGGLNFLPLLAAPDPTQFFPQSLCKQSEKHLSSYTEQSVLCKHGHGRHRPLRGHDPCSTAHWSLKGLAPQTRSMTLWCHTRVCPYV